MENPYAEPTSTSTSADKPLPFGQRCYAAALGIVVTLSLSSVGLGVVHFMVGFPGFDSGPTDPLSATIHGVTTNHVLATMAGLIVLVVATLAGLHVHRNTTATFRRVVAAEDKTREVADQVIELKRQLADAGEQTGSAEFKIQWNKVTDVLNAATAF